MRSYEDFPLYFRVDTLLRYFANSGYTIIIDDYDALQYFGLIDIKINYTGCDAKGIMYCIKLSIYSAVTVELLARNSLVVTVRETCKAGFDRVIPRQLFT